MKSEKRFTAVFGLFAALALSACGLGRVPDTIKPTLSLSGPATVTSTAPVTFTATASDASGIASVRFTRGSTVLGTDTTAPYEQTVTFSAADNGSQGITATATDRAGNVTSVTRPVSVDIPAVDTTPPTVSVSGPATVTSAGPVTFTATASDASGITKVEFFRGAALLGTDTSAPYTQTVTFSAADNGPQTITARATDAAGNASTATYTAQVNIGAADTTPPSVSLTGPATVTSTASVTFNATASDPSGIARVEFFRGGALLGTDTSAPYAQAVSFTAADNGPQTITARATDQAGNRAEARHDLTVNISAPLPNVTGTYVGTYTCNQGLTGLRLVLTSNAAGQVTGTFNFFALASNPGVPTGSYTVQGTLDNLKLNLQGVTWINRPTNYQFANLSGQFGAALTEYSGTVSGPPNCTTFRVTRQ